MLLARVDEYGRGAWLMLTLMAFCVAWPLGFVVFAFLVGNGRSQAWRMEASPTLGGRANLRGAAGKAASRLNDTGASGNDAFNAYRKAELDRLEQEEREFRHRR